MTPGWGRALDAGFLLHRSGPASKMVTRLSGEICVSAKEREVRCPGAVLSLVGIAFLTVFAAAAAAAAGRVPLRVDAPPGGEGGPAIPVTGGVPFPKGALQSVENVRVLDSAGSELPLQVTRLAVWPDGSVKWALIDTVLVPADGKALTLEYGTGVTRAPVEDPLEVEATPTSVRITGGGVTATVTKAGGGVVDALTLAGREIFPSGKGARLVLNTMRVPAGASETSLPTHSFSSWDPSAVIDEGKVSIDELTLEATGPLRVTVLIRGKVLLSHYGETLPEAMKKGDPAGQMPFSMRVSFYRNCPVVSGQHQIIFTGEPDRDYIADWGIDLPGCAAGRGSLILEPGVELDVIDGKAAPAREQTRLAWAPIKDGFALIRQGWQNRPVGITQHEDGARVEFWPAAAGVWDLRRYAREWGVGETAADAPRSDIELYSEFAARGLAKSHDFVLYFGGEVGDGPAPPAVRALSSRALLVAPPGWYGASGALGYFAPEQTAGRFAGVDAKLRRTMDYYLFNQDLFQWYGKISYGNWQTRYVQMHRNDRWERDYGRWAWALNDGAGRIGHMLMLAYLRTLDRRYFEAGEAFNRINYDTNMVHTYYHFENARNGLWHVTGCSHRHNVQPFGCPYIGMRGSYPGGARILYLLTGDGVIKDGLDLVVEASLEYAQGKTYRFGASAGSDGEGAGANALLWAYETTGEKRYLDAVKTILDKSGLIPPKPGRGLGYGPSFGLFNAAGEYADLTGEADWRSRVTKLARMGLREKNAGTYLYTYAIASRLNRSREFLPAMQTALLEFGKPSDRLLADLPPERWPGHGGRRRVADTHANIARDIPYAVAALVPFASPGPWPGKKPAPTDLPAKAPDDWYSPGGQFQADDVPPPAEELFSLTPQGEAPGLKAGQATWTIKGGLPSQVEVNGMRALAGAVTPFALLIQPGNDPRLAQKAELVTGKVTKSGALADGSVVARGVLGKGTFSLRLRPVVVDGVPAVRAEMALRSPGDALAVATWGLRLPLKPGRDAHKVQMTSPGTFRVERWRIDQNDEKMYEWLRSDKKARWPIWRVAGVSLGPGRSYRIWKANMQSTSPLFMQEGVGSPAWLDVTDRGGRKWWGVTVRVLPPAGGSGLSGVATVAELTTGMVRVQFHDVALPPVPASAAQAGLSGAADIIFHDGWRPPLGPPELTRPQYKRFMDDLNYNENYGLFALRFNLSDTHRVSGAPAQWREKITAAGIEPREILYSMWPDQLETFCKRLRVRFDPRDEEGTVRRVIGNYRK